MRNVVYAPPMMDFFGRVCADALGYELVNAGYVGDCNDCHIVGMYDPPSYDATLERTSRAKRRIIHWCGSDVLHLEDITSIPEAIHVCDSDGLRRELWDKGVDATTVMWATRHHFDVTPFPETPQIACYLGTNPYKYGNDMFQAVGDWLAKEMPDVRLVGYQFGQYDEAMMKQLVAESTMCIRLTTHDGSAASPREFMEAGRRAVVTHELDYARRVRHDDFIAIAVAIRETLKYTEPDLEAAAYWHEMNSTERFLLELREVLDG